MTGVQLEVGEQATPFEHRSYADELRRCQRYYLDVKDSLTLNVLNTGAVNGEYSYWEVEFPVQMRDAPSSDISGVSGYGDTSTSGNYRVFAFTTGGGGYFTAGSSNVIGVDFLSKRRARFYARHVGSKDGVAALDINSDIKIALKSEL